MSDDKIAELSPEEAERELTGEPEAAADDDAEPEELTGTPDWVKVPPGLKLPVGR
jgi:hypothetical protein